MMMKLTALALGATLAVTAGVATSDEREALVELQATTLNLIELLVEEGVLSRAKADQLIQRARSTGSESGALSAAESLPEDVPQDGSVIRVPYVPEIVKDEIRAEVREELREEVVQDVVQVARDERWGTKDALPDWLSRIELNGDIRLRYQGDFYADGNDTYFDWQTINNGANPASDPDALLNVSKDENRWRERLRLGMNARINDSLKAGIRLTTGNTNNPVSTNQTLGNYNNRWEVVVDRAYLQYDWMQDHPPGYDPQTLVILGGRFANPFFHTDMVWDADVGFEGVAGTWTSGYGESSEDDDYIPSVFTTLGGFMIEDGGDDCSSKYLLAAQVGGEWSLHENLSGEKDSKVKLGVAYYDYNNMEAKRNSLDNFSEDCTAPEFMQKGNSLTQISNITGETFPSLVGLAGDYDIVNVTAQYDYEAAPDMHMILTADYATNVGFDRDDIFKRTGEYFPEQTDAWHVRAQAGRRKVRRARDWQAFAGYKYIEADAVLDAFNDSDFHLGGTDAKGWYLGGSYGLMTNTWLTARWMSTDEIDGYNGTQGNFGKQKLGIDIFQLDLNARF
jgi:hypothetical protein